ncbi:unnamed protein product, partial [Closterium sp. NIES-65]
GVILRLSSVMYRFRFSLPPHLSLVVRALGSLEGTATTLDPNFKVVATAYPFIIARLLSDPSPDMRAILRQMLLWPSGAIRWQRLQRLASVLSKPSPQHSTGLDHSSPIEAQEGETRARVSAEEKQQTTVSGEEKQGGQRDELREGVDAAAVVAAAGAFETSQKERQRGQRDELREGVDEAAVVAAAGDFLAYVLSAEGSSTRGWLVLDAVAAGQQWVDERVGSTGKERWVEEEEYWQQRCSAHRSCNCRHSPRFIPSPPVPHPPPPTHILHSSRAPSVDPLGALAAAVQCAPELWAPPVDPLGALAAAVQRAPELWVPLLVETAGRAEAREMAGRVVRGVASHAADSAVESALLAVSRWLHSK